MEKVDVKMRNVVFFDGICHLCNGFVDAIITRDTNHSYLFAPLQGSTAEEVLPLQDRTNLDTVIYYESGKLYYRSAAILKILTGLGGAYKLAAIAWIIPGPLRDILYKVVAKNRYSWFGQRDFCRLPTSEERSYLLP
ncbi:thiol-disulfide oxidoreductase DCC family protein [Bdellovibrio svalbardensis]|uniref:DCC1-like thiol-disulfide oxidoreductase family protein n=1 Tax=Bdellovibrio svalbardensis TaxID=2972972 RepID=A0ABT6DKA1_9BACT|nr:DCC1-like thiol-disulfide oxidoreductase family protein [Bdellovibrio svalbardensis]MDG0816349.1 DCC1-like thiol-disulfide oxidoreductase family protein [Bdellovibrio svalbardensis]